MFAFHFKKVYLPFVKEGPKFHWEFMKLIFRAIPEILVPWGSKYFKISGPGVHFRGGPNFS